MNRVQGVWVFAEHSERGLEDGVWKLINEGRDLAGKLAEDLSVIIIGAELKRLTETLAFCEADKVFAIECKPLGECSPEVYVSVLAELVKQNPPSVILFGATVTGNDLASRLAARLKVGLIANYTELNPTEYGKLMARKPIYAGKAQSIVTSSRKPVVATIDPQLIGSGKTSVRKKPQIIETSVEIDQNIQRTRVIDYIGVDHRTVDISEAEIVIGVGKGLDGVENLEAVQDLADVLVAAIGGSRRAVDEGWLSSDRQIGLTGKTIAPRLYLACGLSGTPYHTLGMKESKLVVAVNTDRNAPICQTANLAVIGDMHEIIPVLTGQLRETIKEVD